MKLIVKPWYKQIKQNNQLITASNSNNDEESNGIKKVPVELNELKGIRMIHEDYLWDPDQDANQRSNSSENSMVSMSEGSCITKTKSRSHSGAELTIIHVNPGTNNRMQIVNKQHPMNSIAKVNMTA